LDNGRTKNHRIALKLEDNLPRLSQHKKDRIPGLFIAGESDSESRMTGLDPVAVHEWRNVCQRTFRERLILFFC
jgi:hypothetical protein